MTKTEEKNKFIKEEIRTIVLYEPHKLLNTLNDLYKALGNRNSLEELTKNMKK